MPTVGPTTPPSGDATAVASPSAMPVDCIINYIRYVSLSVCLGRGYGSPGRFVFPGKSSRQLAQGVATGNYTDGGITRGKRDGRLMV